MGKSSMPPCALIVLPQLPHAPPDPDRTHAASLVWGAWKIWIKSNGWEDRLSQRIPHVPIILAVEKWSPHTESHAFETGSVPDAIRFALPAKIPLVLPPCIWIIPLPLTT
jgi:hypothetical protein